MKALFNRMSAKLAFVSSAFLASAAAVASTTGTSTGGTAISADGFDDFEVTLLSWVNGPLGVGLAVTALLVGGGMGVMRATPLPAVAGLALAAFFAWGPGVIVSLVSGGAMVG